MTATDVKAMTAIVRAILRGKWTDELPDWASRSHSGAYLLQELANNTDAELRAVQTAEAFIVLCDSCRCDLDVPAFLKDCGFSW